MNWLVDEFQCPELAELPVVVIHLCGEFAWDKGVTKEQWARWAEAINPFDPFDPFDPLSTDFEFVFAAVCVDLPVVQWFANDVHDCVLGCGFEDACEHGHLDVVQWLVRKVDDVDFGLAMACWGGQLDVVRWLACSWVTDFQTSFFMALQAGHLDVVQHLVSSGAHVDDLDIEIASEHGHTDVAQWLEEQMQNKSKVR